MLNRKLLVICVILLFIEMTAIPVFSMKNAINNEYNTSENIDTIDKKYIASKRIESHDEYNATMNNFRDTIFLFGEIDGFYWREQGDWTYLHINAIDLLVVYIYKIDDEYWFDTNYFNKPIYFGFMNFAEIKLLGFWKDNFILGFIQKNVF